MTVSTFVVHMHCAQQNDVPVTSASPAKVDFCQEGLSIKTVVDKNQTGKQTTEQNSRIKEHQGSK